MSHRSTRCRVGGERAVLVVATLLASANAGAEPKPLSTSPGDLHAPPIEVLQASADHAPGLVFIGPKRTTATLGEQGPLIVDDEGHAVWFHALANGNQAADVRVQRYRGEPVLTWSEGQGLGGVQTTETVDFIVDRSYRVIAEVRAGHGLNADSHEFKLTPEGTALITIYQPVAFDLSPFGGARDAEVVDGIVQEIDVASGRVLFEWHSLDHVAIDESQVAVPTAAGARYDYFHINAVSVDFDGNFIISARNTWTLYKLDRRTGAVVFRLGGKRSDFKLGEGVQFAWQHDPEPVDLTTIRIFDNEAAPEVRDHSRVLLIRRDPVTHTATLVREIEHPDLLLAPSQGNSQALPGRHTFVGFGATGRFSEFDAAGELVFDANVPDGYDDYRAYRNVWHARPDTPPVATATRNADGSVTVHAIWNGATDIARWFVVAGRDRSALSPAGSAAWNGLDTSIALRTEARHVAVVAQDIEGRVVGRSLPVAVE